jgi:hypothetical protein
MLLVFIGGIAPMAVKTKVYIPATVCCFDTHFHLTLGHRHAVRSFLAYLMHQRPLPQ